MDNLDRSTLKNMAADALAGAAYSPKKLILINSGAALGLALLVSLLQYVLQLQIDTTSGLSGLGMRSVLSTAQAFLQTGSMILLPFWEIGLLRALLCVARGQDNAPATLLEGFRRFGPVLRLQILRLVLCFAVAMLSSNISVIIFTLTPFSFKLMEAMLPMLETVTDPMALLEQVPEEVLMDSALPLFIIFGIIFLALYIPVFYRIRLADFAIMDAPKTGAFKAMGISLRATKRNCMYLFRLDLSYWWYYLLELLAVLLCYSYDILLLCGVSLPISYEFGFFGSYLLYIAVTLALALLAKAKVQTTYAVAYDILQQSAEPAPKPQKTAFPWDTPQDDYL